MHSKGTAGDTRPTGKAHLVITLFLAAILVGSMPGIAQAEEMGATNDDTPPNAQVEPLDELSQTDGEGEATGEESPEAEQTPTAEDDLADDTSTDNVIPVEDEAVPSPTEDAEVSVEAEDTTAAEALEAQGSAGAGAQATGFAYVHDPRNNPYAMADIVVNPEAIYGFAPSHEGSLKQYADADWTDPIAVAAGRKQRSDYHQGLFFALCHIGEHAGIWCQHRRDCPRREYGPQRAAHRILQERP